MLPAQTTTTQCYTVALDKFEKAGVSFELKDKGTRFLIYIGMKPEFNFSPLTGAWSSTSTQAKGNSLESLLLAIQSVTDNNLITFLETGVI